MAGGRRRIELAQPVFPLFVGAEAADRVQLFRVLLVQQGTLRMQSAGGGMVFPASCLVLVPPGCACRPGPPTNADVRIVAFGRSLVDPLTLDGSVDFVIDTMSASEPRSARLPARELEQARFLFSSLAREAQEQGPGHQAMVRLKLMEVLLLLGRGQAGGAGPPAPVRFHPAEAMQEIRERCADQHSLVEIAARYGLNPSYFSRLFRLHAGMPLVEFINRARIQKSCQLLKRSDASIVEIALSVGYNNLSHFNRYFRRITGMSPRQYRTASRK